jgi:hygromycin-B 7''-O-kinase
MRTAQRRASTAATMPSEAAAAPCGEVLDERDPAFAELIAIADEAAYRGRFPDVQYGLPAATALADRHGLGGEPLRRVVAGSNLLFRVGAGRWIKIAPPFWSASFAMEVEMLTRVIGRLEVETPRLHAHGAFGGWRYGLLSHVRGQAWRDQRPRLSRASRRRAAWDLGRLCRDLHAVRADVREPSVEYWHGQLLKRAERAASDQRARGASEAVAVAIGEFLRRHRDAIATTAGFCMVHGDLTDEHVLLRRRRGGPRLSGVIDFADAQPAPREGEFLLPFLQLFAEDGSAQRAFLTAYGYPRRAWSDLPRLLMALALCHRFLAVHEWFAPWLANGSCDMQAIAQRVFPLSSDRHRTCDKPPY